MTVNNEYWNPKIQSQYQNPKENNSPKNTEEVVTETTVKTSEIEDFDVSVMTLSGDQILSNNGIKISSDSQIPPELKPLLEDFKKDAISQSSLFKFFKEQGIHFTNVNFGEINTIRFDYKGKTYTITKLIQVTDVVRTYDDITDEDISNYLKEDTYQPWQENLVKVMLNGPQKWIEYYDENHYCNEFKKELARVGDKEYVETAENTGRFNSSDNWLSALAYIMRTQYGLTPESSNEEIQEKLVEFFKSVGVTSHEDEDAVFKINKYLYDNTIEYRKEIQEEFLWVTDEDIYTVYTDIHVEPVKDDKTVKIKATDSPQQQVALQQLIDTYSDVSKGSYAYNFFNEYFNGDSFYANASSFMFTFIEGGYLSSKWDFSQSEFWKSALNSIANKVRNNEFIDENGNLDNKAVEAYIIEYLKTNFLVLASEIEGSKGYTLGSNSTNPSEFDIWSSNQSVYSYLESILLSITRGDSSHSGKKNAMIFVCDIVSQIPEYAHFVTEFFGTDYKSTINEMEDIRLVSNSNHKSLISPIYLMMREIAYEEYRLVKQKEKEYLDAFKNGKELPPFHDDYNYVDVPTQTNTPSTPTPSTPVTPTVEPTPATPTPSTPVTLTVEPTPATPVQSTPVQSTPVKSTVTQASVPDKVIPENTEEVVAETTVKTSENVIGKIDADKIIKEFYDLYSDVSSNSYVYNFFNEYFNGDNFHANAISFMFTFIKGGFSNPNWDFSKSKFWTSALSEISNEIRVGNFIKSDGKLDKDAINEFIITYLKRNFLALTKEIEESKGYTLGSRRHYNTPNQGFLDKNGEPTDWGVRTNNHSIYKYLDSILISLSSINNSNSEQAIKNAMIFVCDIVSQIPEYAHFVTEFFGIDYESTINEMENVRLVSDSNNRNSINLIYLMLRAIGHEEYRLN